MGGRAGGGANGGMGSGTRSAAAAKAAPAAPAQSQAKAESKIDAFLKQAEHNTGDVFSQKPEVKMLDKLHNAMYSGGTQSVNSDVSMDIGKIVPTQNKVWSSHLKQYTKPSKYQDTPIIATYKGKNYVIDGHHRIVGAKLQGQTKVKVTQYVIKDNFKV